MERNQIQQFFTWRSAILQSDLPANARLILLTISCHMNEVGTGAFPSLTTLEKETNLTNPTISKHIKIAEKKGWLIIESRSRNNGSCSSNMYSAGLPEGYLNNLGGVPKQLRTHNSSNNSSKEKTKAKSPISTSLRKQADHIIKHLNTITGKAYRCVDSNREHIIARLNDGFTRSQCKAVIDIKSKDPHFIENPQYMNTSTLFRPKKFEDYLNEGAKSPAKKSSTKYNKLPTTWMIDGKMYDETNPDLSDEIKQRIIEEKAKWMKASV